MKNIIKIITVLATVTSFFPVYSAEESDRFLVEINTLSQKNPLISDMHGHFYTQKTSVDPLLTVPEDNPSYTDEGLSLILTAYRFFRKQPIDEETLQTISDAVSNKEVLTSRYYIQLTGFSHFVAISIRKNSEPILNSIQCLFTSLHLSRNLRSEAAQKRELLINTISQSHRKKLENFSTHVQDNFEIMLPTDIINLIFLFKEGQNLINQAKQKLDAAEKPILDSSQQINKKQQSQPSLNEKSNYFKKIISYAIKNFKETGVLLTSIAALVYFLINLRH